MATHKDWKVTEDWERDQGFPGLPVHLCEPTVGNAHQKKFSQNFSLSLVTHVFHKINFFIHFYLLHTKCMLLAIRCCMVEEKVDRLVCGILVSADNWS